MCALETKYLLHGRAMGVMDLELSLMELTAGTSSPKVFYLAVVSSDVYSMATFDYALYSQTLLLRTPLGPEKVSALQSVLIKRVNLKENVCNGTKKLSVITSVRIKRVSVERGFTVVKLMP